MARPYSAPTSTPPDSSRIPGPVLPCRLVPVSPLQLRVLAVIPARYASTRFPGKPLARLAGMPLIEHVYRRAAAAPGVERVVVATDDARIVQAVEAFGGEARLTRADHRSGSDRLAELVESIECDLVVNVQGDEPLLDPRAIAQALAPFSTDATLQVSTLMIRIRDPETLFSVNAVKVRTEDRKSTRLNSSHSSISYAVFCLKKK